VEHSDLELMQFWQQGDEFAFEVIYKRYAAQLLSLGMRKTNDRDLSEEFVQETFLTLYNNRKDVSKISSVPAYLCTILKNKILDHYRHSLVHKKYEDYLAMSYEEQDFSTINALEIKDLENHLNSHIEKLPPQCKSVFKLRRQEYLSIKEIASRLDISENTVKQHMRKALRLLRLSLMDFEKIISIIIILKIPIRF
jgi:RNA polymerase sigma-70 factor (family 1)